jgi:hypothetical protein
MALSNSIVFCFERSPYRPIKLRQRRLLAVTEGSAITRLVFAAPKIGYLENAEARQIVASWIRHGSYKGDGRAQSRRMA